MLRIAKANVYIWRKHKGGTMIKQKILSATLMSIAVVILFGLGTPVMAESPNETPPGLGTKVAAGQDAALSRLKTRADNEIARRVNALTKLMARINDIKRLTSDQKTTLTTEVQDQINALNTLKTKIDADTDIATLRTDVQSIVKSYRTYALFIPKTYIIVHANRLLDIVDALTTIQGKLQTRIDEAKAAGNDTTAMQNLIADMTTKLADAKTQATNAINAVLPLTPDGYPGNKATLQSARTMLVTARQDIQAAHKDEQQIRQNLVKLGVKVNAKITPVGASPTVTVTPTP